MIRIYTTTAGEGDVLLPANFAREYIRIGYFSLISRLFGWLCLVASVDLLSEKNTGG